MGCNKLLIIGFGVSGASVAAGIKRAGQCKEVIAVARSQASRDQALALQLADRAYDRFESVPDTMSADDLVVVAVPTLTTENIFHSLAAGLPENVTVTDCASVKGAIYDAAVSAWGNFPAQLVLGHPIAGSERSGVSAANPDLYQRHKVILTPQPQNPAEACKRVSALWEVLGAEVLTMSVTEHDAVLAATSHLPHVIAYSLVDTLASADERDNIFRYAAGGFRDFTRIASSDPTMWHDIMLANRNSILSALDSFQDNLDLLRKAIDSGDSEQLKKVFTRAKNARDQFIQGEK